MELRTKSTNIKNILGKPGQGFFQLMDELPQERLSIAVTAVSAAEAALNWTIAYTKERSAFKKKIIEFYFEPSQFGDIKINSENQSNYEEFIKSSPNTNIKFFCRIKC